MTVGPEEGMADFTLQTGCPVCDGRLDVRIKTGLSWGYCSSCHFLGRERVAVGPDSIEVMHLPGGIA